MDISKAGLSQFALAYGALHDGHVGPAQFAATPAHVLSALHEQIIEALGVTPEGSEAERLRARLTEVVSAEGIERNRRELRSVRGYRITVRHGGHDRPIDLRLAHRDLSLRTADDGRSPCTPSDGCTSPPEGTRLIPPVSEVEQVTAGEQSFSSAESSGNIRTVPVPLTLIGVPDGWGATRWADATIALTLTHNQLAQSTNVGETFRVQSVQRFTGPVREVEMDGLWQVRVDTPQGVQDGWLNERSHGRLRAVLPEHLLIGDGTDPADLPEPAAVDGIPLWTAENVGDPRRLLTEVLAHREFSPLADLDPESTEVLEEFLSARELTATARQQISGGVLSPVLRDRYSRAVGWLQCTAVIEPGRPILACPEGTSLLETQLVHTVFLDKSTRLTSGIGLDVAGGPTFTTNHAPKHPKAGDWFGGTLRGRIGGAWKTEEELGTSGSATLTQGTQTSTGLLLTPARVTYRLVLHRSGGGTKGAVFGPWDDGLILQLPPRKTLEGHRPTPGERREPPQRLADLDSISMSELPLTVEGTDALFEQAEAWLRKEGFLPPAEHGAAAPHYLPRIQMLSQQQLFETQLANLRKFEHLRTQHGLAAALPEAVDGGRPLWFEKHRPLTGPRRVRLAFTAGRDTSRSPVHTLVLPEVHPSGSSAQTSAGSRSNRSGLGGAVGAGGGVDLPIPRSPDMVNLGADYAWVPRSSATMTGSQTVGHSQAVATMNGGHVFSVPARYTLDVYEGADKVPLMQFSEAPRVGATGTDPAAPAGQAHSHGAAGTLSFLVPTNLTRPPSAAPVPIGPRPLRLRTRRLPGAGRAAGGHRPVSVDGRPLHGLIGLPEGAVVDSFRGTAALQWVLDRAAATSGAGAVAAEAQHAAIQPTQLIAQSSAIFGGGYLVEEPPVPGLLVDQLTTVHIEGYLRNPRHLSMAELESEDQTVSAESQDRELTGSRGHQISLSGFHRAENPNDKHVYESNSSLRYGRTSRTGITSARGSGSQASQTSAHGATHHLMRTDVVLLVTLSKGLRNAPWNTLGKGEFASRTFAVELPGAMTFLATPASLARHPEWFGRVKGLTLPPQPEPTVPLPERFIRTRELGGAVVRSAALMSGGRSAVERGDRLYRRLTALVEQEAPGATRPGHACYLPGVATEIVRCTNPAAQRFLPGLGSAGMRFQFVYAAWGGARLVEVALSTQPRGAGLRELRGVPADTAGGRLKQEHTDIVGVSTSAVTTGRTHQVDINPIVRYPRLGGTRRTDRAGLPLAVSATREQTRLSRNRDESGIETEAGSVTDFPVPYEVTMSVRSAPVTAWPPNLLGGVVQAGVLAAGDLAGPASQWPAAWIRQMLSDRPQRTLTVPTVNVLRFPSAETAEPREYWDRRSPALLESGPASLEPGRGPAGARTVPDTVGPQPVPGPVGPRLVPFRNVVVHAFDAGEKLTRAMRQVAPAPPWEQVADASPQVSAARLSALVTAGQVTIDTRHSTADLLPPMPGSWPREPSTGSCRLAVEVYNPRPAAETVDISVARHRRQFTESATESSAASSFSVGGQATFSLTDGNRNLLAFAPPLLADQPHAVVSGAASTSADTVRRAAGQQPALHGDRQDTRTYETLVDLVITVRGPQGVRSVSGAATVRLSQDDLLGFGILGPRPRLGVYDLPALLAGQATEDRRDWRRHPVTDLPEALASSIDAHDPSAQMWLAAGEDPDGALLARALFTAARTAVQAQKPVELVLRTVDGPRHWAFAANGRPADTTQATRGAWRALLDTAETYAAAVTAELRHACEEKELERRRPAAAEALRQSQEWWQVADAKRRETQTAHLTATRRARTAQSAADTAVSAAEAELGTIERQLRQAERPPTEQQVVQARLAWRRAQADALHAERLASPGRTLPALDTLRRRVRAKWLHWQKVEERYLGQTAARAALATAQTSVDTAPERRDEVVRQSEAAVAETRDADARAAKTLDHCTAQCHEARRRLHGIENALKDARAHQQSERERQTQAWEKLSLQAVALDSARRAEGIGVPTSYADIVTVRAAHAPGTLPDDAVDAKACQPPPSPDPGHGPEFEHVGTSSAPTPLSLLPTARSMARSEGGSGQVSGTLLGRVPHPCTPHLETGRMR
ncbi:MULTISPECIES: hypothetical protein [Streptomyces]|uniref:hypothetical protein n=1 Tax=Streptomyces TaxID=1883 RepID=UPI00167098E3|nr:MULTISPECIES: hypothetical protein [Streptomyces]